ncbi:MAG: tRNA (adenosine(37)-N6)-dimethylallyltransferase MiaA [Deltaproteobacteria bacterium]|nr:tRNA (adenosine(37)-N6)-dimethylallyltransferase MiaA [Deltaproteobacteria bacterium]
MSNLQKIVIIGGITCAGKTEISLELSKLFPLKFEIVNFDSLCFYKYFDIGTAKPCESAKKGVKHHLFDIKYPDEEYNAHRFAEDARHTINGIIKKGRIPLFVGGTALYMKSLLYGFSPIPEIDKSKYRRNTVELIKKLGAPAVYERLQEIDPLYAKKISPNDKQRIARAYEIYEATGRTFSSYLSENPFEKPVYDYLYFVLIPSGDYLKSCIIKRTKAILKAGLIDEIKDIINRGYSPYLKPFKSIGYKEGLMYLNKEIKTDEELFQRIAVATRQYAKRQATYFKRVENGIIITQADLKERVKIMESRLKFFLSKPVNPMQ